MSWKQKMIPFHFQNPLLQFPGQRKTKHSSFTIVHLQKVSVYQHFVIHIFLLQNTKFSVEYAFLLSCISFKHWWYKNQSTGIAERDAHIENII